MISLASLTVFITIKLIILLYLFPLYVLYIWMDLVQIFVLL